MVVIEKWIQTEQKVEINLSAEDICQCLITSPINDNLDATLELLNTCATILNGIPDLTIREMSQEQKNVVCSFLQKAIDRFLK